MENKKKTKKHFKILFKNINDFNFNEYNNKISRFVYIHISYTFFVKKISEIVSNEELDLILDVDIKDILNNENIESNIEQIKKEILINKIKENVRLNIDTFLYKNQITKEELMYYNVLLEHIMELMDN